MYQDPQEKERLRREEIAKIQERERNLKDEANKRETRYCKTCGRPFWCAPKSKKIRCIDHDKIEDYMD